MRFFFNISKNEMRLQDNHHEKKKKFGDFGWNHKMNYFMNTID